MLAQEMIKPVLFITYQDSFKITQEGIQFLSLFETLKVFVNIIIDCNNNCNRSQIFRQILSLLSYYPQSYSAKYIQHAYFSNI